MHPQIRQQEAGDCPICGMDLVPVAETSASEEEASVDPRAVRLDPQAQRLGRVRTEAVTSVEPVRRLRLTGRIVPDRSRSYTLAAPFAGRIERLLVAEEGVMVKAGAVIARVYAPEMIPAQRALLQAARRKAAEPALYEAARRQLLRREIPPATLDRIEAAGEPLEYLPIVAEQSGHVVELHVRQGDYLERGHLVLSLHDHRRIWLHLDAYESDLPFLGRGDSVRFSVEALPGRRFRGVVDLVSPHVQQADRSAEVRVAVSNPEGRLKPGMLAVAELQARLEGGPRPSVPVGAVLWTGERSVVYVEEATGPTAPPAYQMREVRLGPRLGRRYVVDSGLRTGEQVVAQGAFAVDAAAQLAGKPSMMAPGEAPPQAPAAVGASKKGGAPAPLALSAGQRRQLRPLLEAYLALKNALVEGRTEQAQRAALALAREADRLAEARFATEEARRRWGAHRDTLRQLLPTPLPADSLASLRARFVYVSGQMQQVAQAFRPQGDSLFVQFCPMADDDRGAYWLSRSEAIRNPYFGDQMLTCGNVDAAIPPQGSAERAP
jgi:Cu(I)/Ag(I) efflux system membrane fusion protein